MLTVEAGALAALPVLLDNIETAVGEPRLARAVPALPVLLDNIEAARHIRLVRAVAAVPVLLDNIEAAAGEPRVVGASKYIFVKNSIA